jgi:sigma-E factor negative regulatory protein RseC
MIEIPAKVLRTQGDTAWVVPDSPRSCGACGGKGCGSTVFSKLFHGDDQSYPVENPVNALPGEMVVVAVADGALLKASLSAYLVPMILLLSGALLGARFGDIAAAVGAALGLAVSLIWLRGRRAAGPPRIIRVGAVACGARN